MNMPLDWPQNAASLLARSRQDVANSGELVKLILTGTLQVDSWIIENRVIPALQGRNLKVIRFQQRSADREPRSAQLLPLPDGTAFACNASGLWIPLNQDDARQEIEYFGIRYAPRNHWVDGFEAFLQPLGENPQPATPTEVASWWEQSTGIRPAGYGVGILDEIQSIGIDAVDKAFNVQGRLGF